MDKKAAVIVYAPIIHQGYLQLIERHPEIDTLYVLGPDLIGEFKHLAKEIRALTPDQIVSSFQTLTGLSNVQLLTPAMLTELAQAKTPLVVPQEDIMQELVERYLPENTVVFEKTFLRWDKHNSVQEHPVLADETISQDQFDQLMMSQAYSASARSADWWRHVGGLIVKDGVVVDVAHNTHLPTDLQLYIDGDPRNNFHKGDHLELSTAIHAEAKLIAQAAKAGISLQGCWMYVTTFPCPPCAKLVAAAGVGRLYFAEGYGVLDGESVMKDAGTQIIRVK